MVRVVEDRTVTHYVDPDDSYWDAFWFGLAIVLVVWVVGWLWIAFNAVRDSVNPD